MSVMGVLLTVLFIHNHKEKEISILPNEISTN